MGSENGLPLLGAGGTPVEVRHLSVGGRAPEEGDDRRDGNRFRVQRTGERREAGVDQAFALSVLVTFTRYLVRNLVSRDLLWLCLHWTRKDFALTEEEMKHFHDWVFNERNNHSIWPKDF